MKKSFFSILLFVVFAITPCFCEVFPNSAELVEDFFQRGKYIKIIKDEDNICYFYKDCVAGINIDENDMEIASMGYNVWSGKNGDSTSYNIKKWVFSSDAEGNIIIKRK